MSEPRDYYAQRHGAQRDALTFEQLRRLVAALYAEYDEKAWFQWKMGKDCVDAPRDLGAYVFDRLGADVWPFAQSIREMSEEWLFSVIEFLHEHSAAPTKTFYHQYYSCGTHVEEADEDAGKHQFRDRINALLDRYAPAYELTPEGEVWTTAPTGLEDAVPEPTSESAVDDRVASAMRAFRRYGATDDDKRHAIRDLADVLEHLRATVGSQLPSKDEGDLFNIANNYGLRHHNQNQKLDYDRSIWLDWMFYSFLNAIQLATRVVNRMRSP